MAETRLPANLSQQGIDNYEINETVYGFTTENSPIYLVGFRLQTTTGELYFDDKIKQDQQGQWQVLGSGLAVSTFLFANSAAESS